MDVAFTFLLGSACGSFLTFCVIAAAAAVGEYHEYRDRDPENLEI